MLSDRVLTIPEFSIIATLQPVTLKEGAQEKGRAFRNPGGRRLAKKDSISRWRATPVTPRWGKTKEIRSTSWVGKLSFERGTLTRK